MRKHVLLAGSDAIIQTLYISIAVSSMIHHIKSWTCIHYIRFVSVSKISLESGSRMNKNNLCYEFVFDPFSLYSRLLTWNGQDDTNANSKWYRNRVENMHPEFQNVVHFFYPIRYCLFLPYEDWRYFSSVCCCCSSYHFFIQPYVLLSAVLRHCTVFSVLGTFWFWFTRVCSVFSTAT